MVGRVPPEPRSRDAQRYFSLIYYNNQFFEEFSIFFLLEVETNLANISTYHHYISSATDRSD